MTQLYEQELLVAPSIADARGKLSYHDTFSRFMDIASVHAQMLGCGLEAMARKGLFWLTVKTQIRFFERPSIMELVTARTWPEVPGKLRGNRSYQILRGDQLLIAGKTEWAVVHTKTGKLTLLDGVYPPSLSFDLPSACPEAYARIPDDFSANDEFARYTVCSTDIDVGGHMNNAAYVRAILGCFSLEMLRSLRIGRIDVVFRSPCYEGDELILQRRKTETGLDIRIERKGVTALLARIEGK